jgi:hypothetical protein
MENRRQSHHVHTIYEAEEEGHAVFLWAVGNGGTSRIRITIRNLRDYPIQIQIEPGTILAPRNGRYQDMAVIRPTIVRLEGLEIHSVWLNTVCLQANRLAPESRLSQAKVLLRRFGIGADDAAGFLSEQDDQITTRIDDLNRVAARLGYTQARVQEIQRELEACRKRESPVMVMGYELAPMRTENREELRAIVNGLAEIDGHIEHEFELAQQPVEDLIRTYGRKRVIEELAGSKMDLDSFRAFQYLSTVDSGLVTNVFQRSGRHFKPMEAYRLVEFDCDSHPEWECQPRLNSLVAQYAVWAVTDNHGLEESRKRINIDTDSADLIAAGVRTVLRRAGDGSREGARLGRKAVRFARWKWLRMFGKLMGI